MNTIGRKARLAELRGELRSHWQAFRAYRWRVDPLSQEAAAHALARSLELQAEIQNLEEGQPGPSPNGAPDSRRGADPPCRVSPDPLIGRVRKL